MLVVVFSLIAGIVTMTKDTDKSHKKSNKMMQMRVLFQGLALLFLFLSYMARS
ncbi:MAG: twin transmembrane helix small protein [Alphaproteobacteria bacterium]|nr:twin transmembrane helix small protein [Alphaproteobacteria bacterium]